MQRLAKSSRAEWLSYDRPTETLLSGGQTVRFGRSGGELLCQPGMPLASIVGHCPLCGHPLLRRPAEIVTLV